MKITHEVTDGRRLLITGIRLYVLVEDKDGSVREQPLYIVYQPDLVIEPGQTWGIEVDYGPMD